MDNPIAPLIPEQESSQQSPDTASPEAVLKITEVFYSLQGEGLTAGLPTAFVRLTGCPLRCSYCDTAYAFSGGKPLTVAQIIAQVSDFKTPHVTVTGGEPLAQPDCLQLLKVLCDQGFQVSLETSGERDIAPVDPRVIRVMDLKTPSSGESQRNRLENIMHLSSADQVKFVIGGREDYLWALKMIDEHSLDQRCHLLFSPVFGQIDPAEMAAWMLTDHVTARLQLQLHKSLWGDEPGR
ncbi:MAG: 7-carboxy-7-deazaguanine synthase QueE [Gammaproteobacteria bacterium]|nr:MAG: 7-carboxy-7-deazaguanine synthase QueE [Gammaproteobacteria bacterium]